MNPTTFPTIFLPAKIMNVSTIMNFILPLITLAAAVGFCGMLIYAAFTWLTAGDNPENVTKAWKIGTYAILGLLIVVISFVAVKIIGVIFNTGAATPF